MPGFAASHAAVGRQRCSPLQPGRYSPPQTTAAQCIRAGAREVPPPPLSNVRVRFCNKIIQNCTRPELKLSGMALLALPLSSQLRLIVPASWNFSPYLEVVFLVQESNTSFCNLLKGGGGADLSQTSVRQGTRAEERGEEEERPLHSLSPKIVLPLMQWKT